MRIHFTSLRLLGTIHFSYTGLCTSLPLPLLHPLGAVLLATTSMADTHDAPVDGGAAPLSDEVETNWDESTPSFDLMDLKEELLRVRSFFFLFFLISSLLSPFRLTLLF